jgi:hypothetical protein
MWGVGILLYLGLPNYYRRAPGNVPSFYRSLFRRKTVLVSLHIAWPIILQKPILMLLAVVLRHGNSTKLFPLHNL